MSTTAIYHHIEEDPNPTISFDKGGLSTQDHEYFVLSIGSATVFCTRKQASSILFQIESYFDSEVVLVNPITQEILPV